MKVCVRDIAAGVVLAISLALPAAAHGSAANSPSDPQRVAAKPAQAVATPALRGHCERQRPLDRRHRSCRGQTGRWW